MVDFEEESLNALAELFEQFKSAEFPFVPDQYVQTAEGKGIRFVFDEVVLKVVISQDIDLKSPYIAP